MIVGAWCLFVCLLLLMVKALENVSYYCGWRLSKGHATKRRNRHPRCLLLDPTTHVLVTVLFDYHTAERSIVLVQRARGFFGSLVVLDPKWRGNGKWARCTVAVRRATVIYCCQHPKVDSLSIVRSLLARFLHKLWIIQNDGE